MKITLTQMRAFLALAESLSFTRAAERLGVTQPSLSAMIRSLEAEIGGKLFDRDTRKVMLTMLGQDCRTLAAQLVDESDRVEGLLRSHVLGKRGAIRVAASANLFPIVLSKGLATFRQTYPAIRMEFFDVTGDEAVHRLRSGQVDLAVGLHATGDTDLRVTHLGRYPYVIILPDTHPLTRLRRIRWQDIRSEDVIALQSRDSVSSHVFRALNEAGVMPQAVYRVNELATVAALLGSGFGIGLMAWWSAEHILPPGWTIRSLTEPSINGVVKLMTASSVALSPQLRQLQILLLRHAPRCSLAQGDQANGERPQRLSGPRSSGQSVVL